MIKQNVSIRFWSKVQKSGNCWIWIGARTNGYGSFHNGYHNVRVHRWSYEIAHGLIPKNLSACHVCNNKLCVNPSHIYIASHKKNMMDAGRDGLMGKGFHKIVCPKGHYKTGDNNYLRYQGRNLTASCKLCKKEEQQKRLAR